MIFEVNDKDSDVYEHCMSNGHSMDFEINTSSVVNFSNFKDVVIAKNLFK